MDYHLYDSRRVYTRTIEVDPEQALPDNGTEIAPPILEAGQFALWSVSQWTVSDHEPTPPPPPPATADDVDAERDRRVDAGFPFRSKVIQSTMKDRENIAGAKSAAQDAILLGAEEGEYDWQKRLDPVNGAPYFAWITADNSLMALDAHSVVAMGYAAMLFKQGLIFRAKHLKDLIDAGQNVGDITDDAVWA